MDRLEGNRDYMEAFVEERMPKAHMDHPEGTYIFWIDFRGYGFNDETPDGLPCQPGEGGA